MPYILQQIQQQKYYTCTYVYNYQKIEWELDPELIREKKLKTLKNDWFV